MEKINAKITNDFINVRKRKEFNSQIFIAKYNNGNYYRIFIDRNDNRRLVIMMNSEEFEEFKKAINNFK